MEQELKLQSVHEKIRLGPLHDLLLRRCIPYLLDQRSWPFTSLSQYDTLGSDGAGIRNLYGTLTFEGATYFSDNEAVGERLFEFEGIRTAGGKGGGVSTRCSGDKEISVLFRGEATFKRNKARVRCCR